MAKKRETPDLPIDQKKAIFLAVVEAQDAGQGVADSRAAVAARFGVAVEDVAEVEEEGMKKQWPPLGKG